MLFQQQAWTLEDLFPGFESAELKDAMARLEAMAEAFAQRREALREGMEAQEFLAILQQYEALASLTSKIVAYGFLRFAEDTQDPHAQTFLAKVQQLGAEVDNRTMFFKLWWKGLPQQEAERLMAQAGDYAYWLEALRLHKEYTLSEAEEKIINLKNVNGPRALVNLYNAITNRYVFRLEVDGEVKELTRGELTTYVRHHDPDLRAAAYRELFRVYGQDAPILSQIYQYRVRDWTSEHVQLRGYRSPIAVRNLSNNIPDPVVDTLLETCRRNASLFQRFFALKARWLGVDKIRRYDIYAPVAKSDKTYSFEQAVEMVLDSFGSFDDTFQRLAREILAKRHLDSEVRKGKRSGAFCAGVTPDLTPWVHVSYQGKADDVATLAHELGHGVHFSLSRDHTALTYDASLPLAETASTFAEMLLIDHLLERDPDPAVRRDLLFRRMDDAYATICRQAFFALFERTAHEMIADGAALDELKAAYMDNLREQFGQSLELNPEFELEWVAIPHFYHTPFYVYAYAFGQLLVLSLYEQYRQEGERFKPRYLQILSAGGSDAPMRILDRAGVDVRTEAFWQGGFDVLDKLLDQLEAIPVEPLSR